MSYQSVIHFYHLAVYPSSFYKRNIHRLSVWLLFLIFYTKYSTIRNWHAWYIVAPEFIVPKLPEEARETVASGRHMFFSIGSELKWEIWLTQTLNMTIYMYCYIVVMWIYWNVSYTNTQIHDYKVIYINTPVGPIRIDICVTSSSDPRIWQLTRFCFCI